MRVGSGPVASQLPLWPNVDSTTNLHVHHDTYDRLGEERDSDVRLLCDRHHFCAHLICDYVTKRCDWCFCVLPDAEVDGWIDSAWWTENYCDDFEFMLDVGSWAIPDPWCVQCAADSD
jgi:hypothetical protein